MFSALWFLNCWVEVDWVPRPEVESPAKPKMDDMVNASQLDTLPALPADGVLDTKEEQFKVTMGDKVSAYGSRSHIFPSSQQ